MRKVHHLVQGSPEWHAHRATPGIANGSEIYVKMGMPGYTTRAKLLHRDVTGITEEVDAHTQRRFDRGHKDEALARPLAEDIIGDDLSALVMTDTIDGVLFSVSLDGITQGYDTTFEHKSLNQELSAALGAGVIPDQYHPQCEAGLMVSGATRCLFMASKWDDDDRLIEQKHVWYYPNLELRQRMIAAEKQYAEDRANYVHVEQTVAPTAATIEALPALLVQVEGRVLATNLDAFKAAAQTFIDGIKTELVNDQDFADADKMVKFLKDGEDRLAQAKQHALAQTASIDELFRTVDAISEQMRSKRLALDKLVKSEKDRRRVDIVASAQQELVAHVSKLNDRIGGNWMPRTPVSFADAIKGLKSLDSMRDKVSTALANTKIEANEIADRIEANHKSLLIGTENDTSHLFPDFAQVCTKLREDFAALHAMRIQQEEVRKLAAHKAAKDAEDARIAAAVEAERKAGEARAAAAVEAERMAEAKRAAEAAATDQRGKANAGITTPACEQTTAAPDAGIMPVELIAGNAASAASTPPTPAREAMAVHHDANDEAVIDDFLRLLSIGIVEKKALRAHLVKFERYRIAREMQVAA